MEAGSGEPDATADTNRGEITRPRPLMLPAVAGLVVVGLAACGPAPEPVEVADLVAEFRYAEVAHERPVIDLGSPSATGARAGGWSWNETDPGGTTFAWAVGPRSELAVYLAWQRELDVRVRCRAFRYPGAPAQVVGVLWDDVRLASVELGADFEQRGFVVPAGLASAGTHRLAFVPTYFERPGRPAVGAETGGDRRVDPGLQQAAASGPAADEADLGGERRGDQRKLSIACDWVAIGGGNGAGGSGAGVLRDDLGHLPGSDSAGVGDPGPVGGPRGEGETLWIPVGSEAAFFLEPERNLDLRWDELSARGGAGLAAVWEVEGAAPVAIPIDRASLQPLSLPAPPAEPHGAARDGAVPFRPARLTLRAVPAADVSDAPMTGGDATAGVVLRRPRLTADGRELVASQRSAERRAADEPDAADALEAPEPGQPESILLWIIDTLRVDRLGFHGHEVPGAAVSPNLDALAARSTVFEQAIAQSSWTRPAVATLLTGVGPERHGIRELSHGMEESFVTLPERLRELGYATAGFSANANVTADTGFAQGFDRFEYGAVDVDELVVQALAWVDELAPPGSASAAAAPPGQRSAADVEGEGLSAALRSPGSTPIPGSPGDRSEEKPFFLMILSVEPHAAFAPAEPFRSRFAPSLDDPELGSVDHLRALSSKAAPSSRELVDQLFQLYDGEIAWNDHVFGAMHDGLRQRGHDPLVVVIADHGEAFEERGVFGHAWDLHREVLDIPFFIHLPGQIEGRRVRTPVQQADVLPTLMELAGALPGHDVEGDSLAPLLRPSATEGDTGQRESASPAATLEDRLLLSTMDTFRRPAASLVRGRYKLIELRRPGRAPLRQLFDREADPEEREDLAATRPILAGRLARQLREQVELSGQGAAPAPEVEVDEETRRRLRALGYIE